MNRTPFVVAGTLAGLVGVLAFRSTPAKVVLPTATGTTGASTPTTAAPTGSGSGSGGGSTTTSSASAGASGATSSTAASTGSSGGTPTTAAAATGVRTATGPRVNYYFGVLSVKVTADGSKITKVAIASHNAFGNPRSQYIDQVSIPMLEQQAMSAQSAQIQGVSGASYTSAGFAQSLQGALSALKLK